MTSPTSKNPTGNFRLPLDVKPTHYDLTVRTDLQQGLFEGVVKINLQVNKETSSLVFNVAGLEVFDALLCSDSLQIKQRDVSRSFDVQAEQGTLNFPTPLPVGSKATLSLGFSAKLTGAMMGYYKSSYTQDGVNRSYTLTQFEPTAARRAFPCWDEPLLKATFAITMISRAGSVNLSNMPIISEEPVEPTAITGDGTPLAKLFSSLSIEEQAKDKWKITKFMTTPPMSTYLVAYANGHFAYLESSYKSPLSGKSRPLRVYTTPDVIHQAQYALDMKAKIVPLYEQIFDVEYPLPKLDTLVAHDFDAGAMENWGLITGRTSAFLLNPARADTAMRKRVTVFQSHEVAHMWFGDITTMAWWDYLYLNEGFATLIGEVVVVVTLSTSCDFVLTPTLRIYPEWKVDFEFISEHLNDALDLDAKLSSHPIEVECPDANQINQIFDSLSYAKAASVLRMLSNFVGQEQFLKGVSIYLKKHLYANTVTKDLWEGISESTGVDVPKMMDNWITKIGFPVLTVTEIEDGICVRQDRFLETGPAQEKDNQTIWHIPLGLLRTNEEGEPMTDRGVVLDSREATFKIDTSKPFKLNAGTYGVYRVLYPPERVASIAREASKGDSIFSLSDRIGLVHDAMALAKSGHAKVSSALTVTDILRDEKEFLVWDSIARNLTTVVSTWWENKALVEGLDDFRRGLFTPIVKRLGYEYSVSDSADITQLRTGAIGQAAVAGDTDVVEELKGRFKHYIETSDDSKIPADLFRTTAVTAVKHGGRMEYEFVRSLYENPTTAPSVGISAMYAMCASQDPSCISDTYDYVLRNVRTQDIIYFLRGLQTNHGTRRSSAKFFMDNYYDLEERYVGSFSFKDVVSTALEHLSTQQEYDEIVEFFKDKDTSPYYLALSQTLDSLRASMAWIDRSTTDIAEWLEAFQKR
ncbi:peptidase family M1-domain-containing protein [Phlebopus sp. FC_14]|nr:peptidase family M1-domain-containing protein [Phlebopus sp. FC_14]